MQRIFKIASLILMCCFGTWLNAQTLHAFIVSDDTDNMIGAVVDAPFMEAQMRKIAEQSGLTLALQTFKKSQSAASTLTDAVKNLNCSSSDVVFFYYTGHGGNPSNSGSDFPAFVLDGTIYSMDWIETKINPKNPRLFISIYDACNHVSSPTPQQFVARNPLLRQANYQKLFKQSKGYIKIASNTNGIGKWSYGDPASGGIFTRKFAEALNNAVNGDAQECTWENIKKAAHSSTVAATTNIRLRDSNEMGPVQVPLIQMSISYNQDSGNWHNTPNDSKEMERAKKPD